jgi:VID27 N-terminal region
MFVLKGLGRIIWGDPDKTELVQIASGQLYLVRPKNSVKGTSECMYTPLPPTPCHPSSPTLHHPVCVTASVRCARADAFAARFKDAAASVLRTTTEFNYQLVIQRAYEEGEEQLYEDEDGELQDGKTSSARTLDKPTLLTCVQGPKTSERPCSTSLFTFAPQSRTERWS